MQANFLTAIVLTTLAGLSTTLGSVISVFYRNPSPAYMAATLGFSAGVMIFVSFMELLANGVRSTGDGVAYAAFFVGFLIMYAVDTLISHQYILEDHMTKHMKHCEEGRAKPYGIHKTAVLVAIGIAIHNFPEGIATFMATITDPGVGIALAFAIAVHNIPEGIAVAVPVFAATRSVKKSFLWSTLSGISEPIGALLAYAVLLPFISPETLGFTLSLVAGFMVYISFDELLPASRAYGKEHLSILGVLVGMVIMAVSLVLL